MHKNPNRATGGGVLESNKDATIGDELFTPQLSDYIKVRNELFTLGD